MKRKLSVLGLSILAAGASWAGTATVDFNSDPTLDGTLALYGNAAWYNFYGAGYDTNSNDGFLEITSATDSQRSAIVFKDFDNGGVVQGFTFECDLRIGNGDTDPADGFSISYARTGDPALTAANPATDNDVWATGPNCEANLPEEGTKTGISIGFDSWNSGGSAPYCNEADQSIGPDIIGVSVRVDGTLVSQFATPVKNGVCTDPKSLQTGPNDGSYSAFTGVLCWQHLKVDLNVNGVLNVWWKGSQILTNYQTEGYFPSPGRLVFAGRTGGNNQNQHVDNIKITTIAAAVATMSSATAYPDGFLVTLNDSGSSVVNPATITATLNGNAVTPTATKNGAATTVVYRGFPALLPPGSTNTVVIAGKDTNGNDVGGTRTFVVGAYSTIPAADAIASGVDTTKVGFKILPWQSGNEPNALYWVEEQLLGLHGANNANLSQATDGGYIDFTGVLNFNNNPVANPADGTGGDAGNFQTSNGYPDSRFPGLPGANGLNGSTALEILCFLKFPAAGFYSVTVNSDDGFLLTEGKNPKDRFAVRLGSYNGGKGSSDVTSTIAVMGAGIYPVRLVWENGGGELPGNGSNLEWLFTKDGVKYLVNDPSPTNTTGIVAYYAGPVLPAYVSHLYPYDGATGTRADKVVAQLTDGSTTVDSGSIKLSVDGAQLSPTTTKAGAVTTVAADLSMAPLSGGKHVASIVWNETGGAAHSNSWTFTVQNWVTLDASLAVPLSGADSTAPGFTLQVAQMDPSIVGDSGDSMANQVDSANALLGGLYFPSYGTNTADTTGAAGGLPAHDNVWNWNNPINFDIVTSVGDFTNDFAMPGIPGVTGSKEKFAVWIKGYAAFPKAGYYRMGISSDDGFRISEGTGITRQVVHVTGTGIDRDVAAVVVSTNNGPYGASLPKVPITAPVAYYSAAASATCPMPAANLSGKIVAVNNTTCYDADYVAWAQANGAVAVVVINDAQWHLPYLLGGTPGIPITIPVVCVSGFNNEEQTIWATPGLVASIGADAQLQLGVDDRGRGMGWTEVSFYVPQAGLYPLHMVYEQGGGGAGLEWATSYPDTLATDPARVLVQNSADARSIKFYRAVTSVPTPTIALIKEAGVLKIQYTGKLYSSPTANGSYQEVTGATSPYTVPTGSAPSMFYRSGN